MASRVVVRTTIGQFSFNDVSDEQLGNIALALQGADTGPTIKMIEADHEVWLPATLLRNSVILVSSRPEPKQLEWEQLRS